MQRVSKIVRSNIPKNLSPVVNKSIVSHKVTVDQTALKEPLRPLYNLIGEKDSTTAFITLNRDHKFNTISEGVAYDIARFLRTYEMDDGIYSIWFQNKGSVFSKGIDIKKVKNGTPQEGLDYLKKVYDLAFQIGSFNKPCLHIVDGEIKNGAASMWSTAPHVLVTKNTKWSLNETSFGYFPDCGASFSLSRIPNEVGTYLALTGKEIGAKDLLNIGWAYCEVTKNLDVLKEDITQLSGAWVKPSENERIMGNRFEKVKKEIQIQKNALNNNNDFEFKDRVINNGENAKLVLTEQVYRQRVLEDANSKFSKKNPNNRRGFDKQPYINFLERFEESVLEPSEIAPPIVTHSSLPVLDIARIFKYDTIEEIFAALEKEKTQFAKETLESLKQKSPMSLKITLRLLREGLSSEWADCISREYRVASRRIHDKEFHQGVEAVLNNKQYDFNGWEYKTPQSISNEVLNKYFEPSQDEYIPPVPKNALLPTKAFYHKYPERFRHWINKQNVYDVEVRNEQIFEVKEFLFSKGIDHMTPGVTIDSIREKFFLQEEQLRRLRVQEDRMMEIAHNKESIMKYYNDRRKFVESYFSDSKKAEKEVQELISTLFDEKFQENIQKRTEKAAQLRKFEKMQTFSKLRRTMINNRLIKSYFKGTEIEDQEAKMLAKNALIPLFFPSNTAESYLDVTNPELADHPYMRHINKLKKKSIVSYKNYEEYLSGALPEEITSKIVEKEALPNEKVQPYYNAARKYAQRLDDRERDLRTEEKVEAWTIKYGQHPDEVQYKEEKIQNIINILTNRSKDVSALLKENPNIKKWALNIIRDGNPADEIRDVKLSKQTLTPYLNNQHFLAEHDIELREGNEADSVLRTVNFFDLDFGIKNDSKFQLRSIYSIQTHDQLSLNQYQEQLTKIVNLDEPLADALKPIFQNSTIEASNNMGKQIRALLLNLYKNAVDKTLRSEINKYKSIAPLFSHDGHHIANKDHANENSVKYMEVIDDYLVNNINFEFHRFILPHVFYLFSYLSLIELERMFELTGKIFAGSKKNEMDNDFDIKEVITQFKANGVKIANEKELRTFLEYLNNLSKTSCYLLVNYRDKIHLQQDLMIDKYFAFKNDVARANSNLKNRNSFINSVLKSYEDQEYAKKQLKKAESGDLSFEIGNDVKKLASFRSEDIKTPRQEKALFNSFEQAIGYYKTIFERKTLVPGYVQYLVDLENNTKSAMYGKDHSFPIEMDVKKVDTQIPKHFDHYDLRQPIDVWFNGRLRDVIKRFLDERSRFQQFISNEDLIALDHDLMSILTPSNLQVSVLEELNQEISVLNLYNEKKQYEESNFMSEVISMDRTPNFQSAVNEKIKNPEALTRFITYGLMISDKYKNLKKIDPKTYWSEVANLDRYWEEALTEPEELSDYKSFTGVNTKISKEEQDKLDSIQDLKILKENTLQREVNAALRYMLERNQKEDEAAQVFEDEVNYYFRRTGFKE